MKTKAGPWAVLLWASIMATSALAQSGAVTTVVVPFPAGGVLDVIARILTQRISEQTKDTYIVDNRPGANGSIGAKAVAKSKPDGKTWLVADGSPVTINPFLYPPDPTFSGEKDLRPVRALASQPLVLVVKTGFKATTVKDFVELAKKQEITYSSGGIGSSSHLAMSYLSSLAGGLQFRHIPYRGGPQTINALVAGEVESGFIILPLALPFIKDGRVTAVAVSGAKRAPQLPNVPTMIEQGYRSFEVENPIFAWLPAGTPDDITKKVDALLSAALSEPAVAERIRGTGLEPMTAMGEAESRKWLIANRDIWQKVIRENNIKAE